MGDSERIDVIQDISSKLVNNSTNANDDVKVELTSIHEFHNNKPIDEVQFEKAPFDPFIQPDQGIPKNGRLLTSMEEMSGIIEKREDDDRKSSDCKYSYR